EAFGAGHQLARRPTRLATGLHSPLRRPGRVVPAGVTVATHLTADGRGRAVDQAGDPAQAEALGMTDLNGGAFFNAEFGIGHRGNTVPERSGVALSFCGRPHSLTVRHTDLKSWMSDYYPDQKPSFLFDAFE